MVVGKETTDVPRTDTLKIDETGVRDSHSQYRGACKMRLKYLEKS